MPDWPALILINQFRFFVLLVIAAVYYAPEHIGVLGARAPEGFEIGHLLWCVLALGFTYLIRLKAPSAEVQLYVHSYLDMLCITILLYTSGGITSGLGLLLVVSVALLAQLVPARMALLFAAIGTLMLFSSEHLASYLAGAPMADFERSAMLGLSLFTIAWLVSGPVRRLSERSVSVPTPFRASLDVEQIARLNEEIVQEIDSGVLVVDAHGQVQLMNDSARLLLASEFVALPAPLRLLAPEMFADLGAYRQNFRQSSRPVTVAASSYTVLAHYSNLSRGAILIRLDDHTAIQSQYQHLKLASLGRLSASIAHEIRNPLGALAHAVQLIQESEDLSADDQALVDVALRQTHRIDRIVDDVLHVSNAQSNDVASARQHTKVLDAMQDFRKRFTAERNLDESVMTCEGSTIAAAVLDPDQLDRIVWNLCSNSLLHNPGTAVAIRITVAATPQGDVSIDIKDSGNGIANSAVDKLFEPFFSTSNKGSGLGLFIVRELCHANDGRIDCLPSEDGAHFRITFPASAGGQHD